MRVVGLTGGIGTGKSTVAEMLREEGIAVVDADRLAREVTEPGNPAHTAILAAFGPEVLLPDGRIDRKRLGDIVFASPARRARLEEITHPRIREAIDAAVSRLAAQGHPVAVVEAALIYEKGRKGFFDAVIAAWCDRERQVARLMARDGMTQEQAEARIATQMDPAEKARLSEHVVDTSGTFEDVRRQVRDLAEKLRRLSGASGR
jgi:dephospho-CoA kinase